MTPAEDYARDLPGAADVSTRDVYGSNWPNLYSDLAVEAIRRQKLGNAAEELVLGGNLARILGLD